MKIKCPKIGGRTVKTVLAGYGVCSFCCLRGISGAVHVKCCNTCFIGASYSHHQFFCFDKTGKRNVPHVCCFSMYYCDAWKGWKPVVFWCCTDFRYYDWHCDCFDNKPVSNPHENKAAIYGIDRGTSITRKQSGRHTGEARKIWNPICSASGVLSGEWPARSGRWNDRGARESMRYYQCEKYPIEFVLSANIIS